MLSNTLLQRLPQWMLWMLVVLYALPGLLMRDPWRPTDASHFGAAATMAQGNLQDWLVPNVYGIMTPEEGPLTQWAAALLGKAWLSVGGRVDWLDDIMRLSCLFWLMAICWTIWSTAQRIAKRPDMQPVNPLGLKTERSDYSHSIADCAVLCFLASLGLMVKSHQMAAELPELFGVSIMALAAVRAINRPITAGWALGAGLSIIVLARGWSHGTFIFSAMLLAALSNPMSRFGLGHRLLRATFATACTLGLWALAVYKLSPEGPAYLDAWWQWNLSTLNGYNSPAPLFSTALSGLKTFGWFFWPAWPLALWTLWQHRARLSDSALKIPLAGLLGGLVGMLFYDAPSEGNFFPLLGLMSVLAALGLGTLRRSLVSLIDWFALFIFTMIGAVIWLGWSAMVYGTPTLLVKGVRRLAPDFVPSVVTLEVVIAVAVTLAWLVLIIWRVQRHPRAIWRSLALSSGGATLVWLLMMTLWLPMINNSKSYQTVARQVQAQMLAHARHSPQSCVSAIGLGNGQRASMAYMGKLMFEFDRRQKVPPEGCPWTLTYLSFGKNATLRTAPAPQEGEWELVWEGRRPADRYEQFRLYARR
jgi:4-amino-4-deoxy-L-arabinose transferase-like glycosyltransferase